MVVLAQILQRKILMKFIPLLALLLFPPLCVANVEIDGDLGIGTNDNISNAVSERDIFDDRFMSANLNIAKLWVPATGKSILLGGHLGLEKFNHSTGLDRRSVGSSLSYIHRMGMGAYVPRFSASIRADYRDYGADSRDGWLYRASIGLESVLPRHCIPGSHSLMKKEPQTAINPNPM